MRKLGVFSLQKKKAEGCLMNVYKYLIVKKKTVYSVVPGERTRGNEHKMKYRQFCLGIRTKNPLLTLRIIKH